MRLRGWWLLVSGLSPFVAACALIVGIEGRPLRATADASLPDPCVHLVPPPPPALQDDDEQHDFTVALRSVAYEATGHDVGFDLDDTCTCDRRPGTSFEGGPSCVPAQGASPTSQCDGDGGVDNTFIKLPFLQSSGVNQASLNDDLDCGSGGLILGIYGYNGRANDALVDVAFLAALGIRVPHEPGESPAVCAFLDRPAEVTYRPRWDGTDPWSPDQTFFDGTTTTARYHVRGYVRDWTLVAAVEANTKIPIPFGSIRPNMHQLQLVATVTPLDDQRVAIAPAPQARARFITLDGTLTGRAPVDELLTVIERIKSNDGPQCPGTTLFEQFRTDFCQTADIATEPADDNRGQPCSALSVGVQFHAETAVQGTAVFEDAGPALCDAAPLPCALPP